MGLALSPLLSHQAETETAEHPSEGNSHTTYTIARQKAQVCRHEPDKPSRKSGYRGGPRGGGQTQVPPQELDSIPRLLVHQNRTIAIASDFCVDGAKSPEIPQKEGVSGSEIATRNRKSLATFFSKHP